MSRRRFSVNDLVPSQSEACDASVPRGAKMPKRASQSGETCRAAKRARNKEDSSARKISSSKLLRTDKMSRQKMPSQFVGLPSPRLRGHFLGVVLCRNKYKRAITARFRNVGNISRLRNAQAFHAAVKRPPYFMFARQRRHFTAGRSVSGSPSPRLRGLIWAWLRHNNKENK